MEAVDRACDNPLDRVLLPETISWLLRVEVQLRCFGHVVMATIDRFGEGAWPQAANAWQLVTAARARFLPVSRILSNVSAFHLASSSFISQRIGSW